MRQTAAVIYYVEKVKCVIYRKFVCKCTYYAQSEDYHNVHRAVKKHNNIITVSIS